MISLQRRVSKIHRAPFNVEDPVRCSPTHRGVNTAGSARIRRAANPTQIVRPLIVPVREYSVVVREPRKAHVGKVGSHGRELSVAVGGQIDARERRIVERKRERQRDGGDHIIPVIAGVRRARHNTTAYLGYRVLADARCRGRRVSWRRRGRYSSCWAWRGRWRRPWRRRHLGIGEGVAGGADATVEPHAQDVAHAVAAGPQAVVVADEGGGLGLHIGHHVIAGRAVDVEPGRALIVGVRLIPLAQEVVGVVAAVVPAHPDLAVGQHAHPRVIVVLVRPDGVAVDLDWRRPGGAAVGRAPEQRVAVVAGAAAAAISAVGFQIAAGVDHVDVCRVRRLDAHDRVTAGAEGAATGVDAEDAASGLRGDAGAALHDGQLGDRPGGTAVGRAGHFVAHAGGAAGVLVVILLVAHVDPAVGGYARLAGLLVARSGNRVADQELRPPGHAAVSGLVAGD